MSERSKGGVILIVEDDYDLREILTESLEPLNSRIIQAKHGKEAFEIICSQEIHAVMSDICMPVKDGLGLLKEVRSAGQHMPFVFLTGFSGKTAAIEALKLGAIELLEKPLDDQKILSVMGRVLDYGLALKNLEKELEITKKRMIRPQN